MLIGLPAEEEPMPEHRARKHHQDRVAETLKIEIGAMIEASYPIRASTSAMSPRWSSTRR